ncbi:MAG: RluA family pseudouridine synthase [Myxococcota bacterium]|nr:RluA family pseudouridine synthase [Myxococcota bacterium]
MTSEEVDIPFEVFSNEHGWRADVFLSRRIKRMSRNTAADVIKNGQLRREDGALIEKPSYRVREGDLFLMRRKKLREAPTDDIQIPVIYEDDDVLVVNKPGGLVVHPTASAYHRTLIRILRERRPDHYLTLSHRLDKETSGLMFLARNLESDTAIKEDFAHRRISKAYLAIVIGVVDDDEFVIDQPMRAMPESVSSCMMEVGGEGAVPAVTEVTVISRGKQCTLVEARPKTGRQHQIRVHLATVGHPIIGDKLYLGGEDFFLRSLGGRMANEDLIGAIGHWRQALHAWRVSVTHPRSKEPLTVHAPLPPDLLGLCDQFGLSVPAAADQNGDSK